MQYHYNSQTNKPKVQFEAATQAYLYNIGSSLINIKDELEKKDKFKRHEGNLFWNFINMVNLLGYHSAYQSPEAVMQTFDDVLNSLNDKLNAKIDDTSEEALTQSQKEELKNAFSMLKSSYADLKVELVKLNQEIIKSHEKNTSLFGAQSLYGSVALMKNIMISTAAIVFFPVSMSLLAMDYNASITKPPVTLPNLHTNEGIELVKKELGTVPQDLQEKYQDFVTAREAFDAQFNDCYNKKMRARR